MKKILLRALAVLAVIYLCAVLTLAWAMRQPPETFGRVMMHAPAVAYIALPFETLWLRARAGSLHVGDSAPDFRLRVLDQQDQVQLSSFRGSKPVVLVFGSYT